MCKLKALYYFTLFFFPNSQELCLIRFHPATEEEEVAYVSLFSYFSSRKRFGVVANNNRRIKDLYLIPLGSKDPLPSKLLPFDGPGKQLGVGTNVPSWSLECLFVFRCVFLSNSIFHVSIHVVSIFGVLDAQIGMRACLWVFNCRGCSHSLLRLPWKVQCSCNSSCVLFCVFDSVSHVSNKRRLHRRLVPFQAGLSLLFLKTWLSINIEYFIFKVFNI